MGFLDKAKEAAKQAQQKLDETQQKFNQSQAQRQQQGAPPVEYDKHGRPIQQQPTPPSHSPPGTPGSTDEVPHAPNVEAPPPAGPPPGYPAAKAAAQAPIGPVPGVTLPPEEGTAPRPGGVPGDPEGGAVHTPPTPYAGDRPEGGTEGEGAPGEPRSQPGPPPSGSMGPPPTYGEEDPNAPPRMTSGDPLGG